MIALGGEAIAIDILRDDENDFDYPDSDNWNKQLAPGQPPGLLGPMEIGIEELTIGQFQGHLTDAQGRLNINNLLPDLESDPDPIVIAQFKELFTILELNPGLVDAIADWIDTDTVALSNGAEDGNYTALDPGYRTANSYITSISELRAVNGIDEETFLLLQPHLTAVHPDWCGGSGGYTPVNFNYATAEVMAAVATTQDQPVSLAEAETWVSEREFTGWESLGEINGLPELIVNSNFVTLQSNCLELYVNVEIGRSVLSMYSLLDRSSSGNSDIVTRVRAYGLD